ncbi:MAG: formate dehydrogenase accessory protein FdhE [Nitrospiraceae bacterium]|nr:formate dehydrogenase accessory protein FdhE [Nitrospiraceae bacterium]
MTLLSASISDQISKRLEQIARDVPALADTARLFAAILPILHDETVPAPTLPFTQEEISAQMEKGPLMDGLHLEIDAERAADLLLRLAEAAEQAGARVSSDTIRQLFEQEPGREKSRVFRSLLSDEEREESCAARRDMDIEICRFLAQAAMKPQLRSWSRHLAAGMSGRRWERGTCFVCGSASVIAELQGNSQEKHLRCGLCGADWRVDRLSCSSCGNDDHRSLRTFLKDNDPAKPRIEACDLCRTYVKVIPAFSPAPVDLLTVEDLATLDLDAAARKQGYHRAPPL